MIISIFNSDNNNIAYINTKHCQIMTIISYRILKFESMIKKPIVTNHEFFAVVTFSKINFFHLYQFYCNTAFIISNIQKHFHQDNL